MPFFTNGMEITPTSSDPYEPSFDSFKKKSLAGIAVTFLAVFGYFFLSSDNHNFAIGKNNFASSGSATLNTIAQPAPPPPASGCSVYVADTYNNRIQKFNTNGLYLTQWGTQGSGNGQLYQPGGITTDAAGNVYVTDTLNNRVQKFTSFGTYLTQWGTQGSGNGQFNGPYGITIDLSGNIFIGDVYNFRIQKFTPSGVYISQWGSNGTGNGQFDKTGGLTTNINGYVYVVDAVNDRVQKFTPSGVYSAQFGSLGTGNGQFYWPADIVINSSGNFYVSDSNNSRIQKLTSSGLFISQFGSLGSGNSQFHFPGGIAIDSAGNIYVADVYNNRIQKFDSNGTYLTQWGSLGSGNGQLNQPLDIAIYCPQLPDLTVSAISAPSTIQVGSITPQSSYPSVPIIYHAPVPIDITIKNIGTATATIPTTTSMELAINCPNPANCYQPVGGGSGFKFFPIGTATTLVPGATYVVHTNSYFPSNGFMSGTTTLTGNFNLTAYVDGPVQGNQPSQNLVNESNENNKLSAPVSITVTP